MTITTRTCTACRSPYQGIEDGLCERCLKDSAFFKNTRRRNEPWRFLHYSELLDAWRELRKEVNQWRKVAAIAADNRADRERLERHLSLALLVLTASGDDLGTAASLAVALDRARGELRSRQVDLEIIRAKRDRLLAKVERLEAGRPSRVEEMEARFRAMNHPSIPIEMFKRLLSCCHPDRAANKEAATKATQWLLANRPS